MNEEQKKEAAVFRFGVIHDFVNGKGLNRKEKNGLSRRSAAVREPQKNKLPKNRLDHMS